MLINYLSRAVFSQALENNKKIHLKNQNRGFMLDLIAADFLRGEKSLFVVLPNLYEAQKYYDDLTNIVDERDVLFFPADEVIAAELLDIEGDFKYERINTLLSLLENKKYIVVMNLAAALRCEISLEKFKNSIISIDMNTKIDEKSLYTRLEEMGYRFAYTVTKTGEYSHRGSIIDIFPLNYDKPFRLDLFGDDIDTIKSFDTESQRSLEKADGFKIAPVSEIIYATSKVEDISSSIEDLIKKSTSDAEKEKLNQDIVKLNTRQGLDSLNRYIRLIDPNSKPLIDMIGNKKVYLIDYKRCEDSFNHITMEVENYCEDLGGYLLFSLNSHTDFLHIYNNSDVVSEGVVNVFNDGIDYFVSTPEMLKADPQAIIGFLARNMYKSTLIVSVLTKDRIENLCERLLDEAIPFRICTEESLIKKDVINFVVGEYVKPFKSEYTNTIILDEETLFDRKLDVRKPKYKSIYKNTTKINRYDELTIGDYIVHFDYGVGIYQGIKTLELSGISRDYLYLEYANDDHIYVPIEQISRIEKFSSKSDVHVKLSSLKNKSWSIQKAKAVKRIKEISDNLIRLYASRQASVGFAFSKDTDEQQMLETDFGYELTPDQQKAIIDVKHDMESTKIMDRLICGDVGYGKTEIALRAAFKAVMSGKQVAVLAPTTILSKQHYLTFKSRMDDFGLRIDLLNRLQSHKQQKSTIEGLKSGAVDIVIGTHKLLGKTISFKNLGLLIIDEEQRFGVLQKERIKELKVNVDTLTLSATPIPRTLQMSMVGIKDLSMLETPPKNRYPIQTYVLERNDSIIRDAIIKEITRGGQVFYMYNLTDSIYEIEEHLKSLVPEARFCVGHGKMDKDELEDTIQAFIDKKYDVLVCTTIIETGIDMPDANTLIIHDSNRLGLSQLYQLRGRVGRSDRIAYAYLMYEPHLILNDTAIERLQTIKEFNQLGSGFKIAMKDLAIRGAGDFIGESQSGFIESIGLETFMHILEEEIKSAKGEIKPVVEEERDISLKMSYASRTISNNYIDNEDVKIEIHKKIDHIKSMKDLLALSEELRDRFGQFDEVTEIYMYEKLMNVLCIKLDIKKILDTKTQMVLYMSPERSNTMDGNKIFSLANETSKALSLYYRNRQIEIAIDKSQFINNRHIISLATFLDKLYKNS